MPGDKTINCFGQSGKGVGLFITTQRPLSLWIICQCPEHRLRSRIDHAIEFNQLDRRIEPLAGDFQELPGDASVLRGQEIHAVASHLLPTPDPERTEMAVTVKYHKRFWRWRGDVDVTGHGATLNQRRRGKQHCGFAQASPAQNIGAGMSYEPGYEVKRIVGNFYAFTNGS